MASSKGHPWTNQSLEAWIQRTASVNAKLHFPDVDENNGTLRAQCEYYHQKLATVPFKWREAMGRMSVDVLNDFANCIRRLAKMVDPDSAAWSKAKANVDAVEFLAEYYTWEHVHLDGQAPLSCPDFEKILSEQFSSRHEIELGGSKCEETRRYDDQIVEADSVLIAMEADIVEVKKEAEPRTQM